MHKRVKFHYFSYLKLYKTLPLPKLAAFMRPVLERPGSNSDLEKELTKQLLCFKHKMKNMVWSKGASGLDGSFQSGSEVSSKLGNIFHNRAIVLELCPKYEKQNFFDYREIVFVSA